MSKVLHLEGTADEVMSTSGELSRSLQGPARPVVFRIANRLFAEKSYKLLPALVEKTREPFGAPVEPLDFRHAPDPARRQINRWVEEKTEKRIRDLIPPGGVVPDTRLVLVNAIYFLGDWAVPFEHEATRPAPFHLTASQQKAVPTMDRTGPFRVAQRDGVTALEIPYKGGQMSMMLRAGAAVMPPPREVKADRPFLFLIRDNASGMILFLGRVSDPA